MFYLIIILLLIIAGIEIPHLIRERHWVDLAVVSTLLLVSLVYDIALIGGWQLPNLKQGIETLFGPVTSFLEGLFD